MEFYNKILCVTFEELTGGDEPVIKGNTLSQNVCRGNIQCARQARGEGNYALYVYASLPKKYRMRFVEKYGDPKDVLERQELQDYMQVDEEARKFYESFEYDLNGVQTRLSQKLIDEYNELIKLIAYLHSILENDEVLRGVIARPAPITGSPSMCSTWCSVASAPPDAPR